MGHRHVPNPFMTPGLHHHDNNHTPRIPMAMAVGTGNGPFIVPMDLSRGGVHSDPHWNSGDRSYEYHSSNVTMEAHRHPLPPPRPPVDPYTTHSSITGNTYTRYNVPNTHNIDGGVRNTISGNGGGGGFKRKSPCIYESGNLYGASGSSSSLPPPYRDRGSTSHSIVGEDSMRNVRSRTNCPSHYYQTTTNYPAPVHPVNLNADITSREWNPVPPYAVSSHGRTSIPDINGRSQIYGGRSSVDVDPSFSGNHVSLSQYPHIPHGQSMGDGNNYDSRGVTPSYRNDPYYPHAASWSTNEPQFPTENFASRYSTHHSSGGGYGSIRPRASVEGLHPIHHIMDSHDRLQHELSFSRNFSDQYQDMRLDIDTMTYEELLALEERIGNVSTGLSEDTISKCLREHVYYSHEEATCPICLEEYKKGEKVGRMEKCGHEYHSDCIKKWLMMKKLCPICKSEC